MPSSSLPPTKSSKLKSGTILFLLAAVLSIPLLVPQMFDNVYAHGDAPSTCDNRYDAEIVSMTIDNGVQTFDPLSNSVLRFDAQIDTGYDVTLTLHTADTSSQGNTDLGSTWYRHSALGFANGVCVDNVGPDQDVTITLNNVLMNQRTDGMEQKNVEWGSWPDTTQLIYDVHWQSEQSEYNPSPYRDPGQSTIEVTTTYGNDWIYGYYIELLQNGQVIDSGFSPARFEVDAGEEYTVRAYDYGDFAFDHWGFTGSTEREITVVSWAGLHVPAIYRNVNDPVEPPPDDDPDPTPEPEPDPDPTTESTITVRTVEDGTNNEIFGYYTVLYDNDGSVLGTGFSPATFDVTSGETYTVEVQDYGSYYFNYWQDNNDADRDRTFTADSSPLTLTAVYSTSPNAAPPPADDDEEQEEEEEQPPPQETTDTIITVITTDSSGNQIYGYYTTLSQNDQVIQTAFSPAEFTVNNAEIYQVAVADYGSYVFDHWSDGSFSRFHNAGAGDELIAVYRP